MAGPGEDCLRSKASKYYGTGSGTKASKRHKHTHNQVLQMFLEFHTEAADPQGWEAYEGSWTSSIIIVKFIDSEPVIYPEIDQK